MFGTACRSARAKLGGPRVLEAVPAGHGTMGRLREALFPCPTRRQADRIAGDQPRPPFRSGRHHEGPARTGRAGIAGVSVAVATAVGAGPDQAVALAVLVIEEIGEDRGVEARIVELEAQIVAPLVGAPGPGRPDLNLMRCTA